MSFQVTKVIDGDTFEVSPKWNWNGKAGNIVRPTGYNTPEEGKQGYNAAKERLAKLILGKEVILKNAVELSYGRLLCDVEYNGRNLADNFPEYK